MNKQAVYHAIRSNYSFPVSENELVIRLRTAKGDAESVELIHSMKYEWTQRRERSAMQKMYSDGLFDYYVIRMVLADARFAYIFLIRSGGREYFYSESGVTEAYDYALGYFDFFQCPYINSADVHREVSWARDAIVYQIFVDRFCAGGYGKEKSYVNLKWGEIPDPKSFAGGDLDGIRLKLDYLQETGFNTLYLTPVFESRSNHKYDIRNYFRVDPMFGGERALRRLTGTQEAILAETKALVASGEPVYMAARVTEGEGDLTAFWRTLEASVPADGAARLLVREDGRPRLNEGGGLATISEAQPLDAFTPLAVAELRLREDPTLSEADRNRYLDLLRQAIGDME